MSTKIRHRPSKGIHVEGRNFGLREAQAFAFATRLANEYGRAIKITLEPGPGSVLPAMPLGVVHPECTEEAA